MPFGKDDELALDLLDTPHAFLSLCGLRGFVAKLIYEDLHVGNLAFLCGALRPHLLEVILALLEIGRVVAGVDGDASIFKCGHVVHAGIHERAVVRDDEHSALVSGNE